MTNTRQRETVVFLNVATIAISLLLLASIVWVSDRGIEITDEAYYILSGAYPEALTGFISAQHWALAPLWTLAGSLQHFRLLGITILIGSVLLLAYGTSRVAAMGGLLHASQFQVLGLSAAGSIGALLYVSTISPSPSYNLLASAGGYAALGLAFLCVTSKHRALNLLAALACGVALTITFINKPPAGICCGLLVLAVIVLLRDRRGTGLCVAFLFAGGSLSLTGLVALNWHGGALLQHLETGLALFRQVQTEPIAARLWRYTVTMGKSFVASLLGFAPALALCLYMLRDVRRWMPAAVLVLVLSSIIIGEHYLGGRTKYQTQIEALVALLALILVAAGPVWTTHRTTVILVLSLICLPYAVAMGTGNSMFTQVIVTTGTWPLLAMLLAQAQRSDTVRRRTAQGLALVMMALIVVQVLLSFSREPYHLDQPILRQTQSTTVPVLGAVRVDSKTMQMLADLRSARAKCAIAPGAEFIGLYNVPGLSFLLEAVPPVSPWLTNANQLETLFAAWQPSSRIVLALSTEAQMRRGDLPSALQPLEEKFGFCGTVTVPFSREVIEIWASTLAGG
jgi:hypothetical protein